ncbi:uncharacterized protein AB675_12004 [Cyphellophora attinorum]|uniref:Uncharacterized protein n=1 Tax=Cyphellophora attinorum TaxID=1664694 RepID=A0A0N1H6J3_9EURO|nr:uncharacterized protein AB675_12004 [Phialophora attinorum]KPI38353.1 hypothetical protein AB675_12004 [Phialophora attinorum]
MVNEVGSSQPPPSRYPPSMGPGARSTEERLQSLADRAQQIKATLESYVVEKQDDGSLKLQYDLNNQQRTYVIPSSSMAFPGILTATARSTRNTGMSLIAMIRAVDSTTGTMPSQQAAEGFAEHGSKNLLWRKAGFYGSLAAAGYFFEKSLKRGDMKFPFRKAKDPAKYLKFPNRFVPVIKGRPAWILWQVTRFGVYALYANVAITPFTRSIGSTSMTVGLYRDDRTRPFMEELKKLQKVREGRKAPDQMGPLIPGQHDRTRQQNQNPQQRNSFGEPQDSDRESPNDQSWANPFNGQTTDSMPDGYSDSSVDYGDTMKAENAASATAPKAQPQQQPRQQYGTPRPPPAASSPPPSAGSPPGDDPFAFNEDPLGSSSDPDSPTYNPASASRSQQSQATPRRSWASIRNEARRDNISSSSSDTTDTYSAGPASSYGSRAASPHARKSPAQSESYNYGDGEADNEDAKARARREFDALLERERKVSEGGDGGGGSGGGRRYGR